MKIAKKLTSLSVFFPAFNEEGNIGAAIKQALKVLPTIADKYEVIVINDGSQDKTKEICENIAKNNESVRVVNQRNRGYGGALKRGFAESKYDWIFFTDADLQFNLNELKKLVVKTRKVDLVLGYRLNRADGWKRKLLAGLLKLWNLFWFNYPIDIKDTDCAFKLIKKQVIRNMEPFISDGAMISTELILKAKQLGFLWNQVGVNHYQRISGQPTGSDLRVIWKAIEDTMVIRKALMVRSATLTSVELR